MEEFATVLAKASAKVLATGLMSESELVMMALPWFLRRIGWGNRRELLVLGSYLRQVGGRKLRWFL